MLPPSAGAWGEGKGGRGGARNTGDKELPSQASNQSREQIRQGVLPAHPRPCQCFYQQPDGLQRLAPHCFASLRPCFDLQHDP